VKPAYYFFPVFLAAGFLAAFFFVAINNHPLSFSNFNPPQADQ
jgi:hypothetical protein